MKTSINFDFKIIFLLFAFVSLISCKTQKQESSKALEKYEKRGLEVILTHAMGDRYNDMAYLPVPFNLGYALNGLADTLNVIILGERISQKKIRVKPFGVLHMREMQRSKRYLLTEPMDAGLVSLDVSSIDQFHTQFYSVRWILETWLSNYLGLGKTEILDWKNERVAQEMVIEFLMREEGELE
jgi:inorganic pyrophosphatase